MAINRRGGRPALIPRLLAILCVLPLLLSSAPGKGESSGGVNRLLAIGCDQFLTMPATASASANNARAMERLFQSYVPGNAASTLMENRPGSAAELEKAIQDAFAQATPRDTSWLYLSTHGVTWEDRDGVHMALILCDGQREEAVESDALRRMLDQIPGKKILILDACHTGALIGEGIPDGRNAFAGEEYTVLCSSGGSEESWLWLEEAVGGMGYFTAALENALTLSLPEQIDPDGDGLVSLRELKARLTAIHGASTVYASCPDEEIPLFSLPRERPQALGIVGLTFEETDREESALIQRFHFTVETPLRLIYELVQREEDRWDFEGAAYLTDRERTGAARGSLSSGEKNRKVRISEETLGEDGTALLVILGRREDGRTVPEGSHILRLPPSPARADSERPDP